MKPNEENMQKLEHKLVELLVPLGWEQVRHCIFHSPFAGDVDFSAIHQERILQYAQLKIYEAGKLDGKRSIQRAFKTLMED